MKRTACLAIGLLLILANTCAVFAADKVLFSFEENTEGWEIPDWAFEKDDHVADSIAITSTVASEGKSSLEMQADFPGAKWTGAYIEVQEYFDWLPYSEVSVDVYLPPEAPVGLKAKVIVTVGENWDWTEMSKFVPLEPGKWVTITANLKPGSTNWRRASITDEFRQDVRKFGVRIESNMKPAYKGPIYIDNIRLKE